MNLANGEMLVAGGFAAFWMYTGGQVSPFLAIFVLAPVTFALNWAIYRVMLAPLVRRARSRGQLEVDAILATFGLSFILVGVMLAVFGGDYFSYSYLARPITLAGDTFALNRVAAFLAGGELGFGLDLETCAAGGTNDRLAYVSPRTGRAVTVIVSTCAWA